MNLLGNFRNRPEVCGRGARDTRGEHQERFCYYRLPAGETNLFYVAFQISRQRAEVSEWKVKNPAPPSLLLTLSPN